MDQEKLDSRFLEQHAPWLKNKVKINIKNEEKITAAIAAVEGKAQLRTLVDRTPLLNAIEKAKKTYQSLEITKKTKCQIFISTYEKMPRSYQYGASYTWATIEYNGKNYFLIRVGRAVSRYNNIIPNFQIRFNKMDKEKIEEKIFETYNIRFSS